MGRRELLIALAFVGLGVIAYQFTAPPAKVGQGFSLARFFNQTRQKMQSDRAQASYKNTGSLALSPSIMELRIAHVTRGVTVIGESRSDLAYELVVDSNGPDEATALTYAKRTRLLTDDLGATLAISVDYPTEGNQASHLTLHVPTRMSVRLESGQSGKFHLSDLAAVRLDSVPGEIEISDVAGAVTGQLRAGTFSVARAGSVELTMQATTATLAKIQQKATITIRAGKCTMSDVGGAIEVDSTSGDVTITAPVAPVHVGATGGRVTVTAPRQLVSIDGRRTTIEVTLKTAAPITAITSGAPLRLLFDAAPPAITLDAASSEGGTIQVEDPRLEITTEDRTAHLMHAFGPSSAPRVVLRNQNAAIEIRMVK